MYKLNRTCFLGRTGFAVKIVAVCLVNSAVAQTPIVNEVVEIDASGRLPDDKFGFSVVVSTNTGVVGAPLSELGSVFVYVKGSAGEWLEQEQLVASDGRFGDAFGSSVGLDGDTLIVGTPQEDGQSLAFSRGAAYVYTRDPTGMWTEKQKLVASDWNANDWFGKSVAIDGDTLIVGAHRDGNVGPTGLPHGAAYIFVRGSNGVWMERQKLVPNDTTAGQTFGWAVDISDNDLVVGAPSSPDYA